MNRNASDGDRALAAAKMLDIYTASDLLTAVRLALEVPGALTIDLGNALSMHSAALQVLVAVVRAAQAGKRSVRFEGLSEDMAALWHLAGLNAVLGTPDAAGETVPESRE